MLEESQPSPRVPARLVGRLGPTPDPDGRALGLGGLGSDGYVFDGVVLAVEGDGVLGPEAFHQADGLVGATPPSFLLDARGPEVLGGRRADAHGGEESAPGEEVQGGEFLGEDYWVPDGEDDDAGAEQHVPHAGGHEGHEGDGLQEVVAAGDAVAEP